MFEKNIGYSPYHQQRANQNKQRKSIKKWAKDMNWHYIGTKIYMKRGLKSFIRNMQIKTTLRYNFHLKDGQKSRNSVAYS